MKFEIDLKTLLTLGGILAMLAGFVYTTKLRLENIEAQVTKVEEQVDYLKRRSRSKHNKGQKKK